MATEVSLQECIAALVSNKTDLLGEVLSALIKIVDNAIYRFDDPDNRRLLIASDVMMNLVLPTIGAMELLFSIGFQEEEDRLVLHDLTKIDLMISCKMKLLDHEVQPPVLGNRECIPSNSTEGSLHRELKSQFQQMEYFEIPELQRKAKELIPLEELNREALEKYNVLHSHHPVVQLQDCLLICLLAWFKDDFFSWYDSGFCEVCGQKMKIMSTEGCNRKEYDSLGIRTEIHGCSKCSAVERFPRYFYPGTLLETRKGRCMEWASCFMLMCRSLGFETRYILDKTDHVWNEIYFESEQRWVHADPCENKLDSPLMYEKGWKKSLAYVYAFSKHEIRDCVWKYSAEHEAVEKRRHRYSEIYLAATIQSLNNRKQLNYSAELKNSLNKRAIAEIVNFMKPASSQGDFEGRSSGSLDWRLARGETSPSVEPKFSFTPSETEIKDREMIVEYSIIRDSYDRQGDITKKWNTCVFSSKNVFRKHEKDWKNIYLARTEGSDEGEIEWKFDWSLSGLKLKSISVKFLHSTFENGSVHWQLCFNDSCVAGDSSGLLELTSVDFGEDVKEMDLRCYLSQGTGDVSWQHAQLFRQNEASPHTYPMVVRLNFH